MESTNEPVAAFIEAACVPLDAGHGTGTLERAGALLAAHPGLAGASVHTGAILGDEAAVRRFLERDPGDATARGGPRRWDALTHLCFSRYLRLDRSRSDGFVGAATALLDAGASANTGWFEKAHQPQPVWESVIYGAAGVAKHAGLTRLLLERGADPNDEETPYHAPETWDNDALKVLVGSGTLNAASLATMLLRKTDWHDHDGLRYLLGHGADPNRPTRWGRCAIHNAVLSDNGLDMFETLLDHGADPLRVASRSDRFDATLPGGSAVALAARRGRRDVLDLFARRGVAVALGGLDELIAACARDDPAGIRAIAAREPTLVAALRADGGRVLGAFAGVGNAAGVRRLIDLGIPVDARSTQGDGYFGLAADSTALHAAAWRARHATVRLLIELGASVEARDASGRTPLALAVKACVDSYWVEMRSPESVHALLGAGASVEGISFPSGYAEVDALLRARGAGVS